MDLETMLRETYDSKQIQENVPSYQGFLQDFHVNGSSSNNQVFGVQNPNIDPFDQNFTTGFSSIGNFDVYEHKPFVENNVGGYAHVIDNFQYGGYGLNLPQRTNQLDMMVANQSYLPFNPQETKPLNFVAQDEVSYISPVNYFKRVGMNKNTRRTYKVRKKSNIVKGQWTVDEDRLLIQLVEQYGLRKWSHIAQMLPGRIGKQCRERWHNHLRPDIKYYIHGKTSVWILSRQIWSITSPATSIAIGSIQGERKDIWTDEEDKILIQVHGEIGNKWAEIAKRLPGRTENSIKNHWNATKRRQYSKRRCRSKYPRGSLLQDYIKSLNLDKNPPIDYRKRSSKASSMKNNTTTTKVTAPAQVQSHTIVDQFCLSDRLVPNYDFNEVQDFCFDENLFEDGYSIDSLLDDMPCAPPTMNEEDFGGKMQGAINNMEGKHFDQGGILQLDHVVNLDDNPFETHMPQEIMAPWLGIEVKKELDLVEMMSQVNEIVDV